MGSDEKKESKSMLAAERRECESGALGYSVVIASWSWRADESSSINNKKDKQRWSKSDNKQFNQT